MINEDILTSLKNAIEKGETLQTAVIIAINTGYNPREVEEAARFLGEGVINIERVSQEQLLAMPNQKKIISSPFAPRKTGTFIPPPVENKVTNATKSSIPPQPTLPQQTMKSSQQVKILPPQQVRPIPQLTPPAKSQPQPQNQLKPLPESQTITEIKKNIEVTRQERIEPVMPTRINPPKPSYVKEIILLIILLILIVVLVIVFKFRDQIITFFSG